MYLYDIGDGKRGCVPGRQTSSYAQRSLARSLHDGIPAGKCVDLDTRRQQGTRRVYVTASGATQRSVS